MQHSWIWCSIGAPFIIGVILTTRSRLKNGSSKRRSNCEHGPSWTDFACAHVAQVFNRITSVVDSGGFRDGWLPKPCNTWVSRKFWAALTGDDIWSLPRAPFVSMLALSRKWQSILLQGFGVSRHALVPHKFNINIKFGVKGVMIFRKYGKIFYEQLLQGFGNQPSWWEGCRVRFKDQVLKYQKKSKHFQKEVYNLVLTTLPLFKSNFTFPNRAKS